MKIHESCHNWTLDYNNPRLRVLEENSLEFRILSNVLHLAGDIIDAYNNIPEAVDPEVRQMVLDALTLILSTTKDNVLECIDTAVSAQALKSPLEKGYSEEEVFGINITEEFENTLNPEELAIAAEHLHTLRPVDEELEEDDDGI